MSNATQANYRQINTLTAITTPAGAPRGEYAGNYKFVRDAKMTDAQAAKAIAAFNTRATSVGAKVEVRKGLVLIRATALPKSMRVSSAPVVPAGAQAMSKPSKTAKRSTVRKPRTKSEPVATIATRSRKTHAEKNDAIGTAISHIKASIKANNDALEALANLI